MATAAVAEAGDPELGEEPPVIEPADPAGYAKDVLDRAAEAAALLTAASTGGLLGIGGEAVTEDERSFRDHLAIALAG